MIEATEVKLTPAQEKASTLPYELIATVLNKEDTFATIKHKATGYKNDFRVGDRIVNADIKEILLSKVILDIDGKEEILVIIPAPSRIVASAKDIITRQGDVNVISATALVAKYENINNILKEARIMPYIKGGKMAGVKLSKIKDNSIFKDAGLNDDDIIKKINNRRISDSKDAFALYKDITQKLRTNNELDIDIEFERGGEKKSINYVLVK